MTNLHLDDLTRAFVQSRTNADGYSTGTHAGVDGVQRAIARHLLAIRHDPQLLREALLYMVTPNG